jgi:para-nitrobenzyl esterase
MAQTVKTESGEVAGKATSDEKVTAFLGIPYAAPPVGELRWREPQAVKAWTRVRKATEFGFHCMQGPIFSDMRFPDRGGSEDCLTLNVWTPNASLTAKLPVMVWIYGGGFQAGSTSEPRQNGEFLAHKGVVVVSMNYRLGIFGFFAHPELTKESPHHASGNYGLMDQAAALQWVKRNIAAFGGDPANITIFGESAGSYSVSAQMASPLAKDVVTRAIGESGALFGRAKPKSLSESEQVGVEFSRSIDAASIAKLRATSAGQLLAAVMSGDDHSRFKQNVDGYFLPKSPADIYAACEQARVPLLAGWNRDEDTWKGFFGKDAPTVAKFEAKVKEKYGETAPEILKLLAVKNEEQAKTAAGELATADFIAYGTWKWIETQKQVAPVWRFEFDETPPAEAGAKEPLAGKVAYHSAEIEYVFGTLKSKGLAFRPKDYALSEQMQTYWTNFAKTGDPNGKGLPQWPRYENNFSVMHLGAQSTVKAEEQRKLYLEIEKTVK